jgi:hypothetical protein
MAPLRPLISFLLVWLLLMASTSVIGIAVADDDDDDEDGDDDEDEIRWDEEGHSYEVEVTADEVKIEIESENATVESKLELKFDLDKSKMKLEFEEEAGSSEVKQELEVDFEELIEFIDDDGDGAYQQGETVLRAWGFDSMAWQTPMTSDIVQHGVNGIEIEVIAQLSDEDETFSIVLRVLSAPVDSPAGPLSPTQIKADFIIEGWNWQSNQSMLGLRLAVESEFEVEIEDDGVHADYLLSQTNLSLGFTWLGQADVDGITQPVNSTILNLDGHRKEIVLAYAAGDLIVHDPIIGASYTAKASSSPAIVDPPVESNNLPYGIGALILIALIALVLISRRTEEALDADPLLPWLLPPPPGGEFG